MTCKVCSLPNAHAVDLRLRGGEPPKRTEAWLRTQGTPVSHVTLRKHRETHVLSDEERARRDAAREVEKAIAKADRERAIEAKEAAVPTVRDFAVLVRDLAVTRLAEGEITVTTRDGLAAQAMLDKREQKAADRTVAAQIAIVLGLGLNAFPIQEEPRQVGP